MLDEGSDACDGAARPARARGGSGEPRRHPARWLAALFAALQLGLAPSAMATAPADPPAVSGRQADPSRHSDPDPPARWHLPRKRQRDPLTHDDPPPDDPDWNPLSSPARRLKVALQDQGIVLDLDTAFYNQWASETFQGDRNLATFSWLAVGDWRLPPHTRLGTSYISWTFEGSPGFDHDTDDQTLSGNVGSLSGLNANVYPDNAALDELFWKQVSPNEKWILLAGRVDTSWYFDTNRVANNAFRQFVAFALENNLSIPFPTYGGLGPLVRFNLSPDLYLMAAAGTSESDNPWAPWRSIDGNDWVQLFEVGVTRRIPGLGKGHYRLTPWHNHLSGEDGFGIGFNLDQELGLERLVGFFRFGIGDGDVTPVERFLSGGLSLASPFGRKDDMVALGVAWSEPGRGNGSRDETLLEAYYRISLSPSLALTPDVQLVLDPAANDQDDTVVVLGVRLQLRF